MVKLKFLNKKIRKVKSQETKNISENCGLTSSKHLCAHQLCNIKIFFLEINLPQNPR